jgi:protein-tyrosine phosphatase
VSNRQHATFARLLRALPQPRFVAEHGCKRGYIRHVQALAEQGAGRLRPFGTVEWERVSRLVFVCRGNICRSAFGNALARQLGVPSDSFGLEASSGTPADPVAARVATRLGVALPEHRARRAAEVPLGPGDLVIAFEPRHARALREIAGPSGAQVTLLGLHLQPRRPHIEDPYGLGDAYFERCFALIERGVREIAHRIAR